MPRPKKKVGRPAGVTKLKVKKVHAKAKVAASSKKELASKIKQQFDAGYQKGVAEAIKLYTKIASAKAKLETEFKTKLGKASGTKTTKAKKAKVATTTKKRGRKAANAKSATLGGVVSSMTKRRGRPAKKAAQNA